MWRRRGGLQRAMVVRWVQGFMSAEELAAMRALVEGNSPRLRETKGHSGLGPRYRVVDGDEIQKNMLAIASYGRERIHPIVESHAGRPLQPPASPKRAVRVQVYDRPHHDFRWHFDGARYAALLTLENTNGGKTEAISPRLSSVLRFAVYPLYAFPRIFSVFPRASWTTGAGDLLIVPGAAMLHRGLTTLSTGRRILIAYAFDEAGRRPNPLRDRIARALDY